MGGLCYIFQEFPGVPHPGRLYMVPEKPPPKMGRDCEGELKIIFGAGSLQGV